MRRVLSGNLAQLDPPALIRLLAATGPTGVLDLVTDAGSFRLEMVRGRVAVPSDKELDSAGRVLRSQAGAFRFEPAEVKPIDGDSLSLMAWAEAARAAELIAASSPLGDVDIERLMAGEIMELARMTGAANIHVLPRAPLENPLDELLTDLEATAPSELLLTQVGVVAQDPRFWRGAIHSAWRHRGWELFVSGSVDDVDPDGLDALVLHQEAPIELEDLEGDWLALVRRATTATHPVPVVWVGSPRDSRWVRELIEAGVAFMMPPPRGRSSEARVSFAAALAIVLDRLISAQQMVDSTRRPRAMYELVDTLLDEADSDEAVGSLLQLASTQLTRGAVLMVEDTAIRCRAGYGYPFRRSATALPRGLGLLERAIRGGESIIGIDPDAGGAPQLARVFGVDRLPRQTAVVALGAGAKVVGLLVADREGEPLPVLRELTLLACCLGGVVVRNER